MSNPGPPRSKSQIARDAKLISELYLSGYAQGEIASELSVSQSTISLTLREYHEAWLTDGKAAVGLKRHQIEQRLEYLYRLNLESFKTKKYPGFLKNAASALASISKLNGLDRLDITIDAKVGINSLHFHEMMSKEDTQRAMDELEQWQASLPSGHKPRAEADNGSEDLTGQDSEVMAITEHSEALEHMEYSETIEPAPAPVEPQFEVLDPNSPDFKLTI